MADVLAYGWVNGRVSLHRGVFPQAVVRFAESDAGTAACNQAWNGGKRGLVIRSNRCLFLDRK